MVDGAALKWAVGVAAWALLAACAPGAAPVTADSPRVGVRTNTVVLGPGPFTMGTGDYGPEPIHAASVGRFAIDRTEVTVAEYEDFLHENRRVAPKVASDCNLNAHASSRHPINCVTWQEARDFCAWSGMRLPTDAEWEYAARGWEGRKFPWGAAVPSRTRLNAFGEECRASGLAAPKDEVMPWDDGFCGSAPVGSFPEGATPDGVLDLAGNVWEWIESGCEPPEPLCMPGGKIARGGGFLMFDPELFRGAVRRATPPESRNVSYGFRCAVSVDN